MEKETRNKVLEMWVRFVVICAFFAALNYFTSSYPWVLWVIGSYGFAMVLSSVNYIFGKQNNVK